ncbi:MAG: phosphate acyltransferase PlsX [Pleurocapsa sp.]
MGLTRARIAVDAMGGDYAPDEIVAGAILASEQLDIDVLLVGDEAKIKAALHKHGAKESNAIAIVPAEDAIAMKEEPLTGIRRKPKASINVAMNLVKQQEAQAVVSAGHSGAAMASALLRLGRLKGIDRPAIGAVLPTIIPDKSVIVLDVGANVDSRPKYLEQFALMGTIYSKYVLGNEKPKLGLLNIGEESCKGNELALQTYQLLENNPQIPFVGNAEGRDVLSGDFDIIVCDGFVGNVLLKFAEAVGEVMLQIMREELPKGWRGKLGTALLKPNLNNIKQRIDRTEHGGALLFGVAGVCIISHGSSQAASIFNAIRLAKEAVDNEVLDKIKSYNEQRLEEAQDLTETASAS